MLKLTNVPDDSVSVVDEAGTDGPAVLKEWVAKAAPNGGPVCVLDRDNFCVAFTVPGPDDPANWAYGAYRAARLQVTTAAHGVNVPEDGAQAAAQWKALLAVEAATEEEARHKFLNPIRDTSSRRYFPVAEVVGVEFSRAERSPAQVTGGLETFVPHTLRLTPAGAGLDITVRLPVAQGSEAANWVR